jgi:uncharacterized protein (TIGR03067 family)
MRTKLLAGVVLLVLVAGGVPVGVAAEEQDKILKASGPAEDAARDLEKLQGSWTIVSYTVDGKPTPDEGLRGIRLEVKGNRSRFTLAGKTSQGTYHLDASKKPRELDITLVDEGPDKGKRKLGIYEIDGDRLRICLGPLGSDQRPKEFASRPGSGTVLEVWTRARR